MPLWPWAVALFGPPLAVALLAGRNLATTQVRILATVCACIAAAAGLVPLAFDAVAEVHVPWPWSGVAALGPDVIALTELSRWLVGLPAWLWLITVAVTPRTRIDQQGLRRTALATTFSTLAFATTSPGLLAVCWSISIVLFARGLTQSVHARTRRVLRSYLWPTAALLMVGVVLSSSANASVRDTGLWLIVVCILVRKGIFPFHAWIPEAFENGRLGPVVLFCAPQLGTYVAAILVVPNASPLMLEVTASLSLVTAIYGAALAVVQSDARRACGYLFVSQSALVLAGLHALPSEAATGALVLWLASALAFTGLARIVLALEARRGRLDLRRHHGGAERMPMLAASFLVLGLACTGFPGTLGFVGEELLIDGVIRDFPVLGFLTVGASAFTGLAVVRMYFSLFCGAHLETPKTALLRGEAIVFTSLAAVLVLTGLAPGAVVRSRARAVQDMRRPDDARVPGSTEGILTPKRLRRQ